MKIGLIWADVTYLKIEAMLSKSDISYLLENTDFDEYDIREWFREFLKVSTK